jgi:hypothetical protein
MAYMNQERKKELAPAIKAVLKKYGMKGTIAVRDHMVLVVNIKEGVLDLLGVAQKHNDQYAQMRGEESYPVGDHLQVNQYYAAEWAEKVGETKVAKFYNELIAAMKGNLYYDNSDAMTDYFDTAYYMNINVGNWNKPYNLVN